MHDLQNPSLAADVKVWGAERLALEEALGRAIRVDHNGPFVLILVDVLGQAQHQGGSAQDVGCNQTGVTTVGTVGGLEGFGF